MMFIDVEAYSKAGYAFNSKGMWVSAIKGKPGIKGTGGAVYAQHPSTRLLSVAWNMGDGLKTRLWYPGLPYPEELISYLEGTGLIEAHNCLFEYLILYYVCHLKMGWPYVAPDRFTDSMAKALAFGLPAASGNIPKAIDLEVAKQDIGKKLIAEFCVPHNRKKSQYRIEQLYEYNIFDVDTQMCISKYCPDLIPFEKEVFALDQRVNARGVHLDKAALLKCIDIVGPEIEAGNARLFELTDGKVKTANQVKNIGEWLESRKQKVKKTKKGKHCLDKEAVEEALENPILPKDVKEVYELRQQLALSSVSKLPTMLATLGADDRVRGILQYAAAQRTGRWAGRLMQVQNFTKANDKDSELVATTLDRLHRGEEIVIPEGYATLKFISGLLRGLICAAPGNVLISSDYKAIEAVVMAEVAEEPWRQEVFRTHGLIYETSVSKITRVPLSEIMEPRERTGKHHPLRNSLGKVAELASGFGGWINAWKKFGASNFLTDEEIKKSILAWREESPNIVEFWGGQQRKIKDKWAWYPDLYGCEGAVVKAIQNPGERFHVKSISYIYDPVKDVLLCRLPSGRNLVYQKPRLTDTIHEWSKLPIKVISFMAWRNAKSGDQPAGWSRYITYSGKLAENIIQAIARDLLAYALVNVDKAGYSVVMHVHDEIVSEVKKGFGSIEDFERIMSIVPEWAKGWPVKASGGWIGPRFKK